MDDGVRPIGHRRMSNHPIMLEGTKMKNESTLSNTEKQSRESLENILNWPFGKEVENHIELNLQVREAIVWLWNLGREEQ